MAAAAAAAVVAAEEDEGESSGCCPGGATLGVLPGAAPTADDGADVSRPRPPLAGRPKVMVRPQASAQGGGAGDPHGRWDAAGRPQKTMEEKEAEYIAARARIFGPGAGTGLEDSDGEEDAAGGLIPPTQLTSGSSPAVKAEIRLPGARLELDPDYNRNLRRQPPPGAIPVPAAIGGAPLAAAAAASGLAFGYGSSSSCGGLPCGGFPGPASLGHNFFAAAAVPYGGFHGGGFHGGGGFAMGAPSLLLPAQAGAPAPVRSGPHLPRRRIAPTQMEGRVLEWKGKYGWIRPEPGVQHPKAGKHRGKIFVSMIDLVGAARLEPGGLCRFFLFEDEAGLGAEECAPILGGGAPGGGAPAAAAAGEEASSPTTAIDDATSAAAAAGLASLSLEATGRSR